MNDEDKTGSAPCENSFKSHIMSKPKQWVLSDQTEKFRVFRYEAPEGSESALWVELRWSLKRELYTAFRSNAVGEGELWIPLAGRSSITPSRSAKPSKRSLGPACPLKRRALADLTYSKFRQANWIIFVFPVPGLQPASIPRLGNHPPDADSVGALILRLEAPPLLLQ
jgi:hypothetical protein